MSARPCPKSCPAYKQTISCSCGQPGDSPRHEKHIGEDLDCSEVEYVAAQSHVASLKREIARLKIAHLRRMADIAESRRSRWAEVAWHGESPEDKVWRKRNAPRMGRFHSACLAKITELKESQCSSKS